VCIVTIGEVLALLACAQRYHFGLIHVVQQVSDLIGLLEGTVLVLFRALRARLHVDAGRPAPFVDLPV